MFWIILFSLTHFSPLLLSAAILSHKGPEIENLHLRFPFLICAQCQIDRAVGLGLTLLATVLIFNIAEPL